MIPVTDNPEKFYRQELHPADPAAGAPLVYAYAGALPFHILHLSVQFVTDANPANRQVWMAMEWAGITARRTSLQGVIAAAATRYIDGFPTVGSPAVVPNTAYLLITLPNDYILLPGLQFVINAFNIQATDQFSACYLHGRYIQSYT